MQCNTGNEFSASEAIRHMWLRLSAEQAPSVDGQKKTFENSDKMIEHMRSQLNASPLVRHRNALSP